MALLKGTDEGTRLVRLRDNEHWLGRAMLAPAVVYIALLIGFPFFLALYYSLSDITVGGRTMNYVGLRNFLAIVQTPTFRLALQNTLTFAFVSQILVLILANVLAQTLMKDFRGKWLVRFLILLPWVAPISLGSIGWLWMFDSIYSVINWTLQAVGILDHNTRIMWLGKPALAMASVITVHVCSVSWTMSSGSGDSCLRLRSGRLPC